MAYFSTGAKYEPKSTSKHNCLVLENSGLFHFPQSFCLLNFIYFEVAELESLRKGFHFGMEESTLNECQGNIGTTYTERGKH